MDRINKLCAYLDKCTSFADVGCDHGYCTRYMLKNGLCERAVISDVSPKSLAKAETLLSEYIKKGVVKSVCCDGLQGIESSCEQVLIAGMGGEEIVGIFKTAYVPNKFVLQPMKNVRAVREYLLSAGAEITVDEVFKSGDKFYFVIKGKRQGVKSSYSKAELNFGKNLQSFVLKQYLQTEINKKHEYLSRDLSAQTRAEIEEEIKFLQGVYEGEIK